MLEIKAKLKVRRGAYRIAVGGALRLPFEERRRSRLRARLVSGEEVALVLPRGEVLRGGDLAVASDGRVIEVIAEPERLLQIECASSVALARAAYHLGNRHVPVELGEGYLRILADHVLEDMLKGLGAKLTAIDAPFEPEAGAYSEGHRHAEEPPHGARIHEHGDSAQPCGHEHSHDHDPEHRPHGEPRHGDRKRA